MKVDHTRMYWFWTKIVAQQCFNMLARLIVWSLDETTYTLAHAVSTLFGCIMCCNVNDRKSFGWVCNIDERSICWDSCMRFVVLCRSKTFPMHFRNSALLTACETIQVLPSYGRCDRFAVQQLGHWHLHSPLLPSRCVRDKALCKMFKATWVEWAWLASGAKLSIP